MLISAATGLPCSLMVTGRWLAGSRRRAHPGAPGPQSADTPCLTVTPCTDHCGQQRGRGHGEGQVHVPYTATRNPAWCCARPPAPSRSAKRCTLQAASTHADRPDVRSRRHPSRFARGAPTRHAHGPRHRRPPTTPPLQYAIDGSGSMQRVRSLPRSCCVTTGDLLNAAKALFAGPGLVGLHAAAAHAAILGRILPLGLPPPMP
jgi:hypothetical protein